MSTVPRAWQQPAPCPCWNALLLLRGMALQAVLCLPEQLFEMTMKPVHVPLLVRWKLASPAGEKPRQSCLALGACCWWGQLHQQWKVPLQWKVL